MKQQSTGQSAPRQTLQGPRRALCAQVHQHDIELLVEMDKAHEDVRGPAIVHLLKRAYKAYGDARYVRLAHLSPSHLYNLRKSAGYKARRVSFNKSRPVRNNIGVRRAPRPNGHAGFVRSESVYQGDEDGMKGVYHITCVGAHLSGAGPSLCAGHQRGIPATGTGAGNRAIFVVIKGCHSENGSRYVNHKAVKLL